MAGYQSVCRIGEGERAKLVEAFARLGFVAEDTCTGGNCWAIGVRHAEQLTWDGPHALITNGDAGLPWSLELDDDDPRGNYELVACVYTADDPEGQLVMDDTGSGDDSDTLAAHVVEHLRRVAGGA